LCSNSPRARSTSPVDRLVDPIAPSRRGPVAIVRSNCRPAYDDWPIRDQVHEGLKGKVVSLGGPKDITRIYSSGCSAEWRQAGELTWCLPVTAARASALQAGAVDAAIVVPPFTSRPWPRVSTSSASPSTMRRSFRSSGSIVNRTGEKEQGRAGADPGRSPQEVAMVLRSDEPPEAVAILVEVSKIKTEDVEKSYDFLVKGKFFEQNA